MEKQKINKIIKHWYHSSTGGSSVESTDSDYAAAESSNLRRNRRKRRTSYNLDESTSKRLKTGFKKEKYSPKVCRRRGERGLRRVLSGNKSKKSVCVEERERKGILV